MLNVVMLDGVMLKVVMLSDVMLNVVMLSVVANPGRQWTVSEKSEFSKDKDSKNKSVFQNRN
jgi:hypothetical protein